MNKGVSSIYKHDSAAQQTLCLYSFNSQNFSGSPELLLVLLEMSMWARVLLRATATRQMFVMSRTVTTGFINWPAALRVHSSLVTGCLRDTTCHRQEPAIIHGLYQVRLETSEEAYFHGVYTTRAQRSKPRDNSLSWGLKTNVKSIRFKVLRCDCPSSVSSSIIHNTTVIHYLRKMASRV